MYGQQSLKNVSFMSLKSIIQQIKHKFKSNITERANIAGGFTQGYLNSQYEVKQMISLSSDNKYGTCLRSINF